MRRRRSPTSTVAERDAALRWSWRCMARRGASRRSLWPILVEVSQTPMPFRLSCRRPKARAQRGDLMRAQPASPTMFEMCEEVLGLITGAVVGLMPFMVLSVPFAVALGLVLIPIAALTIAGGVA